MASYDSLKDYIRLNKMDVISEGLKEFIKTNQKEVVGYNIKNIVIRTLSCQPQEWIMKSSDVNNDLFFTIGISAVIKNSNVPIGSLHYYNIDLKGNAFDDLSDLSLFHITEVDSEDSLQKETFLSLFGLPEITNECFEDKAEELYKKILSLIKHLGVKDEYKYQFPIDIIETKLKIDEYFADLPEKCVAKILMESSKEKIYLPVLPLTSECLTNLPKGSILLSKNNLFNYNYFPDRIVTVAHELIHWVLHQSFYKIMKILGSDNRLFKYVDKFETFNDSMSSQDKAFWYAENQAEELSYRLSMPKHLMESAIIECIESESKYQTAADFNENIVKTLAGMFEVSYLTMKKRLIQLGYDFVNGTLVNVDGEDYPPFTFTIGILSGIVKKCAVGEYPKSWIGRSQAAW